MITDDLEEGEDKVLHETCRLSLEDARRLFQDQNILVESTSFSYKIRLPYIKLFSDSQIFETQQTSARTIG